MDEKGEVSRNEGESFSLSISAGTRGGDGNVVVKWFHDNEFLAEGNILTIDSVSPADHGVYHCVALNGALHSTSGEVLLNVIGQPADLRIDSVSPVWQHILHFGSPRFADSGLVSRTICVFRLGSSLRL